MGQPAQTSPKKVQKGKEGPRAGKGTDKVLVCHKDRERSGGKGQTRSLSVTRTGNGQEGSRTKGGKGGRK
eukprot:363896-Chlamydomonas_euryale.AAC.1